MNDYDYNQQLNQYLISNIEDKIKNISFITSIISLISSIIMSLIFLVYNRLRSVTYNLFFIISISEMIHSTTIIIENQVYNKYNSNVSKYTISALIFFSCFSDIWNISILSCLTYNIYNIFSNDYDVPNRRALYIGTCFLISAVYSLICAIVASVSENIGKGFYIYYFISSEKKYESNKALLYVHHCVVIIFVFISYYFMFKSALYIKRKIKTQTDYIKDILKTCKDLYDYPFYGSIGWIIGFPVVFITASGYNSSIVNIRLYRLFYLLSKFFINLKGFIYFILFMNSKKVLSFISLIYINLIQKFITHKDNYDNINDNSNLKSESSGSGRISSNA